VIRSAADISGTINPAAVNRTGASVIASDTLPGPASVEFCVRSSSAIEIFILFSKTVLLVIIAVSFLMVASPFFQALIVMLVFLLKA
jgi:hypothetical protein